MTDVKIDDHTPWLILGYVGDGAFEGLLQINSGTGMIKRILGKSDCESRDKIATVLDAILKQDSYIEDIRWHAGDFANPGWTEEPSEEKT